MGSLGGGVVTADDLICAQYAAGDECGGVWLACACASAVLYLVQPGEQRPAEAVRLARAWACGEPCSDSELWVAARAAAARLAAAAAAASAADAAWMAGRVATAASWAAEATRDAAREAAAWAARADPSIDFVALLRYEVEPIVPTLGDVGAARPEAAVIWDCYAVELGPVRFGSLGDALSRARVLRLDWQHPVERALAERLPLDHAAWAVLEVAP